MCYVTGANGKHRHTGKEEFKPEQLVILIEKKISLKYFLCFHIFKARLQLKKMGKIQGEMHEDNTC